MNARDWRHFRLILRNDLRLIWRGWLGKFGDTVVNFALWITLFVILQVTLGTLIYFLPRPTLTVEAGVWLFAAAFIFSSCMTTMQLARPDGVLLFSSPVAGSAVLGARLCSQTLAGLGPVTFFLLPGVNALALRHGPGYLAGYVVLVSLGFIGSAFATGCTLLLIRWLGARRALNAVRITGFILVALAIIVPRLAEFRRSPIAAEVQDLVGRVLASPPLQLLAEAGRGALLPLLGLLVLTVGASVLLARLLQRSFAAGAQEEANTRRVGIRPTTHRWNRTLGRTVFWKELRLLWREPMLFARMLPTFANLLPMFFVFRSLGWLMLSPLACIISHLLTMSIAPTVVAGDEAWDLARSSPTPEIRYRLYKLVAALTVPLLALALFSVGLALVGHPLAAAIAFLASLPGNAAIGWFFTTSITPNPRRGVVKQKGGEGFAAAMLGLLIGGLGSGALAAYCTDRALLGSGLLGAYLIAALFVFIFAKLRETPDWKFEEMRRAPVSK